MLSQLVIVYLEDITASMVQWLRYFRWVSIAWVYRPGFDSRIEISVIDFSFGVGDGDRLAPIYTIFKHNKPSISRNPFVFVWYRFALDKNSMSELTETKSAMERDYPGGTWIAAMH